MTQIVINTCHGGFGLSDRAQQRYCELAGQKLNHFHWEIARNDPYLVQTILELGEQANDACARLKVVDIPDDVVEWSVHEYNGIEWVAEVHRTWN